MKKVSFQGEHGAYSESAARKIFDEEIELIPCNSFQDTDKAAERISTQMNDEVPAQLQGGNVFREGIHAELDKLRELATGGKQWIADMQEKERDKTGISKLKVGFNKVFGYFLEVSKVHQDKVPENYIRKQTLVNAERYITEELKEYEEKILSAEENIIAIESELFSSSCLINSFT